MNKLVTTLLSLLFIAHCSFGGQSGFWNETTKIKKEKETIIKELFKKEEPHEKEMNTNLKINLNAKLIKNSFINNFDNNNGRIEYDGNLKNISKYKFSKIDNFNEFEPEIVFDKNNVIFFDNKGSIIKFNEQSKIIWKKNYYSKTEKKMKPVLFLSSNSKTLVVADSISKYYALDINSGKLLWSKSNVAPFNSQVKVYKDRFFVIDYENILRCYSIKNGNELWKVRTEKSFIKSQKKLSLVIVDNKVFFNNSIGDISAVDIATGNLIWQQPTQSSAIYEDAFLLKTSSIIASNESVLFSNNKNEFFSLYIKNGGIKWKQRINSTLRHTLIENTIFSISMEGFLILTNNQNGAIIRITDIFKQFSKKKRSKIKPVGFIVGSNNIYLTTNNGRLLIIDILTGKTKSVLKIDGEKISRPFVLNKNMFIVKDNAIIKLN